MATLWRLGSLAASALVSLALPVGLGTPAHAAGETCDGKAATIVMASGTIDGTAGDDVIVVTGSGATIDALGGDDTVCGGPEGNAVMGGPGDDTIFGGAAADDLSGGVGDDTIFGEGGDDLLAGESTYLTSPTSPGPDADTIDGGTGNDTVVDDWGDDTLSGGPGKDTIRLGEATDDPVDDGCIAIEANARLDVVAGTVTGFGKDTFTGFETYVGGTRRGTLVGSSRPDTMRSGQCGGVGLVGKGGNDRLRGESAWVNGGIVGGPGSDRIVISGDYRVQAGRGNDVIGLNYSDFAWTGSSRIDGGSGTDKVIDDSGSYDKIALSRGIFADGEREVRLSHVENASELRPQFAERIVLVGTASRNVLIGPGPHAENHQVPVLLLGRAGNDRLIAGRRDTANGGRGNDYCVAQHRVGCERR